MGHLMPPSSQECARILPGTPQPMLLKQVVTMVLKVGVTMLFKTIQTILLKTVEKMLLKMDVTIL